MNKKSIVIIIILIVLLIVALGGLYFLYNYNKELSNENESLMKDIEIKSSHTSEAGSISIPSINLYESFADAMGDIACVEISVCNFVDINKNKKSFLLAAHNNEDRNGYFRNINKLKKGAIAEVFVSSGDSSLLQFKLESISTKSKSDYVITKVNVPKDTLILVTPDKNNPESKYLVLEFKFDKEEKFEEVKDLEIEASTTDETGTDEIFDVSTTTDE